MALSDRTHVAALLALAAPIAVAQLAQMAMSLTDTLLLGRLGGGALAAGGLAAAIFFTTLITLQSGLSAVGVLASQARGAGAHHRIPLLYGTGLGLGLAFSLPLMLLFGEAEAGLRWLGEPATLAHDAGRYLAVLRWGAPALLGGVGLMRALLPAIGAAGLLLRVTPAMALLNLALNALLIFGLHWHGLDIAGHGLLGSALATAITLWLSSAVLFACVHTRPTLRPIVAGARFHRPSVAPLLLLGAPIAVTAAAEMLLFLATGLRAGLLGAPSLAAHQIALSVASVTFMLPLALSQAANMRTGFWHGARDFVERRRAGLVAIVLALVMMLAIGGLLAVFAPALVRVYIDPGVAANQPIVRVAVSLLLIAALFQVADGVQTTALGALRGLGDTKVPMLIAAACYWLIGFPLGGVLAFGLHRGAQGLWEGMAAALAGVAVAATVRFVRQTRPAAVPPCLNSGDPATADARGTVDHET